MTLKGIAKGLGWVVLVALAVLVFFYFATLLSVDSVAAKILFAISVILFIGVLIEWITRPFRRDKEIIGSKHFAISDVLGFGWKTVRANLWFFVGLTLVAIVLIIFLNIFYALIERSDLSQPMSLSLTILSNIIGLIISTILGIGFTKIALSFCDGRKPSFGTLFDFHDCFWRYLGAGLLYTLLLGGLLLLVAFITPMSFFFYPSSYLSAFFVCGLVFLFLLWIVWAIKFSLWPYFVIDKKLGPIRALKASSRTTMGIKWKLFGFGLLCGLIILLGLLCLVVGVFVAYPMVKVATALVYRRLMAQTPELAEFNIDTTYSAVAQQNTLT